MAKEKIPGKASIVESVSSLLDKIRGVKPGAAKESAARGAASTKDLIQLSIGYVKQETKQPLVGIGRLLSRGLIAAILISTGLVLLLLGLLRGIQAGLAFEQRLESFIAGSCLEEILWTQTYILSPGHDTA